ncbi:integrase catalytic domain-containing protein [Nephila pilipes]|uniref:Integrase catalytic domain-containing protein n=1 Tax=Nephila pilipes TaxID=299642 RepID=A0A8X6ULK5_NEPPI|nr:integrase catalytic domain-containing protein [Nephila pilipes]
MFLQEVKEVGIPDLDLLDSKSLNKRYDCRQRLWQDLSKRFRSEYLGQLRQYEKKMRNSKPLEIGDVVLISSDNTKRLDWSSGKVIELFTSPGGNIRLIKLKTEKGKILRPVLRLYSLEVRGHERSKVLERMMKKI